MEMTRSRYVRMTCSMMKEFGCNVQEAGDSCWVVPCSGYNKVSVAVQGCDDDNQRFVDNVDVSTRSCSPPRFPLQSSAYEIEPDASSATYFLAMAAVTGAYVLSLALHQAQPFVLNCNLSISPQN
jgi:5-enolpyruvylshikimate-3-phosphate synthase